MRLTPELYDHVLPFLCKDADDEHGSAGLRWQDRNLMAWAGVCRQFRNSTRRYISEKIALDGRLSKTAKEELGPDNLLRRGDIGKPIRHLHRLLCRSTHYANVTEDFCLLDPTITVSFGIYDEIGNDYFHDTWDQIYERGEKDIWVNVQHVIDEDGEEEEKNRMRRQTDQKLHWLLEKANTMLMQCLEKMPNLTHFTWATGLPFLLEILPVERPNVMLVSTVDQRNEALKNVIWFRDIPKTNSIPVLLSKCTGLTSLHFANSAFCDIRTLSLFTHLKRLDIDTYNLTSGLIQEASGGGDDDDELLEKTFLQRIIENNPQLESLAMRDINDIERDPACMHFWSTLDIKLYGDFSQWESTEFEDVSFPKALTTIKKVLLDKRRHGTLTGKEIRLLFTNDDTYVTFRVWMDLYPQVKLEDKVARYFNTWYEKSQTSSQIAR